MRFLRLFMSAVVVTMVGFLAHPVAAQQSATVTGTVTDQATGQPISGARILIVGTNRSLETDQFGRYTIRNAAAGSVRLRVLHVGYTPVEVESSAAGGETTTLDVALSAAVYTLEEIVTTAQGQQLKREIGNAVANIGNIADIVEAAPVTNFQDLLNARAPGVHVMTSTGTVGNGSRIRIRGLSSASLSNDPLIYVDGVRVEGGSPGLSNDVFIGGGRASFFNDFNPEDIESIEIVKGPSASTLYGTQAANGVIRITTKRGRAGPARWNLWVEQGTSWDPADYPGVFFSRAQGGGLCLPWQEAQGSCTIDQLFSHNLLEAPGTSPNKNGHRQQYGASVRGGTDVVRYYASAEWEDETGTLTLPRDQREILIEERGITSEDELNPWELEPNESIRTNLRANVDATLGPTADLSVSTGFTSNDIQFPQTGDNLRSVYAAALYGSANPDAASPWGFSAPNQSFAHRVVRANDRFTTSGTANWRPTTFLGFRGTAGIDFLDYEDTAFNFAEQGCQVCGNQRAGVRTLNKFRKTIWYGDGAATANYQITDRIGGKSAAGVQYTKEGLDGTFNTSRVFPPGGRTIDAGATKTSSETNVTTVTVGYYVEQTLSLDDRLFATGALRLDRNSAFGSQSRSAWYPKGSLSWVVREDPGVGFLGQFRVRGAIGASGLQPGANDALLFLRPVTAATILGDVSGLVVGNPALSAGLGNSELKPERSREIEGGFDLSLWSGRVNLEATYYRKRTTDALVQRPLPGSLGATLTRTENLAQVNNQGVEVALNARILEGATTWDVSITATGNKNRLITLGENVPPITGFGFANKEDYPLFGLWWPRLTSFSDDNGNGIIEPEEVVVSDTAEFGGSSVPVRTATFSTSLSLFNNRIVIGGLLDYRGGFVNLNVNNLFQCGFIQNCQALNDPRSVSLEEQAKAIALASGTGAFGAYFEPADFLKWREASMTFNFPDSWARAFRAQRASLAITGRNLAMITGFNSWDPELNTQGRDDTVYNFVQQTTPRAITFRLNLSF